MEKRIVNLNQLHKRLALTTEQKELLTEALETLMRKYEVLANYVRDNNNNERGFHYGHFTGVADGLNNAYKIINNIDDDYNLPKPIPNE